MTPIARDALVATIEASGIDDSRLIEAFRKIPRADFVPEATRSLAYVDRPLPIPHDQVTTQPSLSARMIDALEVRAADTVLEIGTGYGFQTALLATLAGRVVTIERFPALAEQAKLNLTRHQFDNVDVLVGDGSLGAPNAGPFDAILVSAAFPEVPAPLVEQLAEGGRLVQPIGPGGNELVTLFEKRRGRLVSLGTVVPAHFVRLVGQEAFPKGDIGG